MLPVAPVPVVNATAQEQEHAGRFQKDSLPGSLDLDGAVADATGASRSPSAQVSGMIGEASAQALGSGGVLGPSSGMTSFGSTSKHSRHHTAAGAGFNRLPSESISLQGLTVRFNVLSCTM